MNQWKKVTHVVAVGFATVAAFAISPAGQAVVKQYPKLAVAVTLIGSLGALYHEPKQD